jgi:hypothetical protein
MYSSKYVLRTCLKCGYEFKSRVDAKYPQCWKCHTSKVIESKEIPFDKKVDELKKETRELVSAIEQFWKETEKRMNNLEEHVKTIEERVKTCEDRIGLIGLTLRKHELL